MSANPFELSIIAENISFEEFLQRYDGQNVEWHAGKVIEKVTNNTKHNLILLFLSTLLNIYLAQTSKGKVLLAGIPMYLGETQIAREPDLMIVLPEHEARIKANYLEGIPDMALEIVSPSSTILDRGIKFEAYEAVGIPEYWLIDPLREAVQVYALNEKNRYQALPFNSKGEFVSKLLPNFALQPNLLWQEELPNGLEIMHLVEAMLKESS